MDAPVYLDCNATTPVLPQVVEAMYPYLTTHFGNPSSGHATGRRAKEAVERARAQVAAALGCSPDELVFTSGGTEANNLALLGGWDALPERRRNVVTSVIEHPATGEPCRLLERRGARLVVLGVDEGGRVGAAEALAALDDTVGLVSLMHANNETGVLQPVAEVARAARARGALVHTDAAQSLGKVPVNVATLGVDLLSLAGHKVYAPKGVGALYVRRGVRLHPVLRGAGHELGLRPGTENVASIVALGRACEVVTGDLEEAAARMRTLRDLLEALLQAKVPGLALNGARDARLPNTLNVRFPDVGGDALLDATPQVEASTGSACHDGHDEASAVVLAMGVPRAQALSSVRLTLGRLTTEADVRAAAAALAASWNGLRPPG